jgi:quinol monooxygenase YgiN
MILVIGHVVKEGQVEQALALSLDHVRRSRTEPGCVSHAVHQDAENPLRLVFVEEWSDMAALQQHFKVAESRRFVNDLAALTDGAPHMQLYDAKPVVP